MSSGLDWNEPSTYNSRNDEMGVYWRSSQSRYLFDRPAAAPAGTLYNYNGGGTAVLAQILAERVGISLPDYARKVLFEPLGITNWEWPNDVRGRPLAFAGLRLRSRDLARIGRMVICEDKIRGRGAARIETEQPSLLNLKEDVVRIERICPANREHRKL